MSRLRCWVSTALQVVQHTRVALAVVVAEVSGVLLRLGRSTLLPFSIPSPAKLLQRLLDTKHVLMVYHGSVR